MYLHMDGARICNAAVSLGVELRETTADAGVDVLSFGGTKNGLMGGEAVIFFRPELAVNTPFIRKQGMQLSSKMRFISAQFLALFENDLWRHNAAHANAMAQRLHDAVVDIPGVTITQKVQANGVFAILPAAGDRQAAGGLPASMHGTRPAARCAGCARGTPPRTTSTRSHAWSPRSYRRRCDG